MRSEAYALALVDAILFGALQGVEHDRWKSDRSVLKAELASEGPAKGALDKRKIKYICFSV